MQGSAEGTLTLSSPKEADRFDWVRSIPFILVHVVALGVFLIPFKASYVGLAMGLYYLRMFGVTAGYHRYFSHRSYKTSRVFQFLLAWLAVSSSQKGVLWWASHHREHHRYSDRPEDVHSPVQRGIWWAHMAWAGSSRHASPHRTWPGSGIWRGTRSCSGWKGGWWCRPSRWRRGFSG